MKKKIMLLYGVSLIALAVIWFAPFRPFIIIHNDTGKKLYIHSGERGHGVEPEPEEVEKIIRSKPDVIEPGEAIKLTSSFGFLISDGFEFNVGWLIGGGHAYNATGGGGQDFLFSSTIGTCSVSLIILDGYNNYLLKNEDGDFCLKKLYPFKYKY
ncbi:hypothetical protein DPK65_22855 [Salmonella enterica subsp. enterica]|nr:hypothetical protein [Salmonella enterica subsp. enterica]ECJ4521134.1 hypothetical protein [Salmonella enterica subsp. enterica]